MSNTRVTNAFTSLIKAGASIQKLFATNIDSQFLAVVQFNDSWRHFDSGDKHQNV